MTCTHKHTTAGRDRCYAYCVAPDDCDPRAHGGIYYEETCDDCGATRLVAVNYCHCEEGEWSDTPRRWV